MAAVDVGARGTKRAMNAEINMIPFVDLLLVTVAFLLVTAVWTQHARLDATSGATRSDEPFTHDGESTRLEVRVGQEALDLVWKQGHTVVSERRLSRSASQVELAAAFETEWQQHGGHKSEDDRKSEEAVIRSDDRLPFKDLVGVMDAMAATRRSIVTTDGRHIEIPVFAATFAVR